MTPLLEQILIDSGEAVYSLARDRLGVGVPRRTVREQARELGVTRARIYQLLEDCGKVMHVRWPEGRSRFQQLGGFTDAATRALMHSTRQLFFPEKGETQDD